MELLEWGCCESSVVQYGLKHAVPLVLVTMAVCGRANAQAVTRVERVVGEGRAVHERMLSLADSGFSGAVIVERNDTLLLAAGYGLANRERKIPFSPSTIAQVGSITKQFTATAIADLVQRGRLRYTDSLATLFPDLAAGGPGVHLYGVKLWRE